MKIKALNPQVRSMKLYAPIDGLIDVDANGVCEVSPKCAVLLVSSTNDWEYLKKKDAQETEETEEDEAEEKAIEKDERKEMKDGLSSMNLEDMKLMAEEGGYPKEEWEKLTSKKLMISYLLKKFDEASNQ